MSSQFSRRTFLVGGAAFLAASSAGGQSNDGKRAARAASFDVDRFIDDVERALREKDGQAAAQEVLARAVSDPRSVLTTLGEPKEVGIHTLHRSDDLTILNVVWAPLMVLLPHNHKMWASIGIYTGREDNVLWKRKGPVIEANLAAALSEKEVFGLGDDAIHSVVNPIAKLTGAIHVYGGDFFAVARSEWDSETLRERPFDLEAARRTFIEANERFKASR